MMTKGTIFEAKILFLLTIGMMLSFSGFVLATQGDMDGDGYTNGIDLPLFADQWLNSCASPDWCGGADINHSGNVDFGDFTSLARNWSTETPIWSDEFDETSLDTNKWNIYSKLDGV